MMKLIKNKECIERGEINHTTGGAILTKEEKEFWGVIE